MVSPELEITLYVCPKHLDFSRKDPGFCQLTVQHFHCRGCGETNVHVQPDAKTSKLYHPECGSTDIRLALAPCGLPLEPKAKEPLRLLIPLD